MDSVRGVRREGSPSYARVSNFMGLFTDEEVQEWALNKTAPEWVKDGIEWFMDQAVKEAAGRGRNDSAPEALG